MSYELAYYKLSVRRRVQFVADVKSCSPYVAQHLYNNVRMFFRSCQLKLRGRLFKGSDSVTATTEDFSQEGRHFHRGRGFMTGAEKSYRHY